MDRKIRRFNIRHSKCRLIFECSCGTKFDSFNMNRLDNHFNKYRHMKSKDSYNITDVKNILDYITKNRKYVSENMADGLTLGKIRLANNDASDKYDSMFIYRLH